MGVQGRKEEEGFALPLIAKKKKFFDGILSPEEQTLTMIGEGISVVGTLIFKDGVVRLDGHLNGKIVGQGTLVIGEKGFLQGEMEVNTLILNGRVEGQILASGSIHISSTGKLVGKVQAGQFIIDRGGIFEGEGNTLGKGEPDRITSI
jgi:cytoskeletal protein CcmA (bactofilin family)